MKLGAEPKKVAILGGLTLLAAYSFYTNVLSEPDLPQQATRQASTPAQPAAGPAQPAPNAAPGRTVQRRGIYGRQATGEFRPTLKYNRPEDRPDPMKVDPTLRLDLLAKLQSVKIEGGARSLFDFTTAPPPPAPKTPDPKIIPGSKKGAAVDAAGQPPAEVKPAEPVKPPPPPIPFKFYGFSDRKGGIKRAFFLEGEDIFVAAEGDMIKRRYKVVKIGLNSVEVEDTQHQHKQTLPLEPAPAAG